MPEHTVLVVEDEVNLLEAVKYNLDKEGYRVLTASDGERGLDIARESMPSIVILDLMLPKLDGLQVCQLLRRDTDIPILMLTAKTEEIDRVVGLEMGADDYVTKPFSMRELMARVKALIRRSRLIPSATVGGVPKVLIADNLAMDLSAHEVMLDGETLALKPREFELLEILVSNKNKVFTREQILRMFWGHDYVGDIRTVDVHVRWLREKIEVDPSKPRRIITVRGMGYRFEG